MHISFTLVEIAEVSQRFDHIGHYDLAYSCNGIHNQR